MRHQSGFERQPGDTYVTPQWVWEALYTVEPWAKEAWDCCPVNADFDFLQVNMSSFPDIATNPPYGRLAEKIIRHAIDYSDRVAVLLPVPFDSAKTRRDLFERKPFKVKYTLTDRIRWANLPQRENGPTSNHAWFVWDRDYDGKPFMGWLP